MGEKFILLNKKLCFGLASLLRLPETFILDARAIFELVFKINLGREKDNKSLIAHFRAPQNFITVILKDCMYSFWEQSLRG